MATQNQEIANSASRVIGHIKNRLRNRRVPQKKQTIALCPSKISLVSFRIPSSFPQAMDFISSSMENDKRGVFRGGNG
ncbi:hypothetical protein PIB30_001601 [Stylosanthes scabra]|uniref:Uncharacterized protein n=1 Tax=Stylosanthes scabra TaxID=79078 RepID=A0ABU6S2R2_9FABA|nr:hypothetical protein [Stylosanthes scabra]